LVNLCLQTNPLDEELLANLTHTQRRLIHDMGIPHDKLCPKSMRGLFWRSDAEEKLRAVPSKVLVFPGSEVSYFLSQASYPNDGRHYGFGMYLPFKRALQGIAHEYARATTHQRASLMALVVDKERGGGMSSKKNQKEGESVWHERLEACYHELNAPEAWRIKTHKD
jgi:hypothetical protein